MAAGMSRDADPARLIDRLGNRWAVVETSFKYHACCRHTHPAADALLQLVKTHALSPAQIVRVTAHVHQAAIDVLGPVVDPQTVHQAKFSMGVVLGLIATRHSAGMSDFDAHFRDGATIDFAKKVRMTLDDEVNIAYPARWIGKVTVETTDGRTLSAQVDEPKGDPGNTLSRRELEDKALALAAFSAAASPDEMRAAIQRVWTLADAPRTPRFVS
jgi:2-methylcitrate dehydratase PrpD